MIALSVVSWVVYQLCHGWDADQLADVVGTFMLLDVFEVPLPELKDGVDFKDVRIFEEVKVAVEG